MSEHKSVNAALYYKNINRKNVWYFKVFSGTLNFIIDM